MKSLFVTLLALVTFNITSAQETAFPLIKDYGEIYHVPMAKDMPDKSVDYKIIAECGDFNKGDTAAFESLDMIARMVNLHIEGGVKPENLHLAFVVYANAANVALTDEAFRKKFGYDNPSTKLIADLKAAGVELFVCGQSVAKQHIKPEEINPNVTLSLSRITTVSTYQMNGYAMFVF